jgi:hypothetical protein
VRTVRVLKETDRVPVETVRVPIKTVSNNHDNTYMAITLRIIVVKELASFGKWPCSSRNPIVTDNYGNSELVKEINMIIVQS